VTGSSEIAVDPLPGQPLVQVPAGRDIGVDRLFFVGTAVAVVDRPQVVLELGDGCPAIAQRHDRGRRRAVV
jgi:hypothetical protein